ncbi:1,4-alpha-glucan branching protein GlgB [Guptibacillus algicola]|uniref:1,4-alpha-glucan branching protein GlgB n=1 Tax=Guptibacillus algicola TaxID=225844 RepID=UPI001CD42AF3|nr:1,4-alpha-glucan branching protein GlgB [Alkalihalobacillus algicola]MCA0988205.1 1,4-alpha-glucan branching protein GlgB [Alkalihalobacillus algicola]
MTVSMPTDYDRYLFHQGNLFQAYRSMGAHLAEEEGTSGVRFTVWAPHAKAVAVAGNFNEWDATRNHMHKIEESGLWSLYVEGLGEDELYKYAVTSQDGSVLLKSDPYAFYSELKPKTASIVKKVDEFDWQDSKWMNKRKKAEPYENPISIYEVHPGSWRRKQDGSYYSYEDLTNELIPYVKEHGYTHIELMPVMEHPFDRSWGYQITGYFSVTSRFGEPNDLKKFIDRCHQEDIGVILDWVPAHFCKDAHGLGQFDGGPVFEPSDPELAERRNWGTYNFDYSKPEIVSFLISNAFFWFDLYHIDGLRIDAVSQMILYHHEGSGGEGENLAAKEFLQKLNKTIFEHFPNALMMAEESTDYPLVSAPVHEGGLGFNYKWNMGWMNDTLKYMELHMDDRKHHHNLLTFSFFYAFSENYLLPLSHDEVVHGKKSLLNKMPGDYWQKFANLRTLYGFMMTHPGKKLLFMGGEFGQFDEWKDLSELDWMLFDYDLHKKTNDYVKDLNKFYLDSRALWRIDHAPEGFEWIDANDQSQSVLSFMRKGKAKGDCDIVICNFSANVYYDYRIGVHSSGQYVEMFNSDQKKYGGSGQVNADKLLSEKQPYHNQPCSLQLKIPPLGIVVLGKKNKSNLERRNRYV